MADKPVTREEKYLAYLTGDYKGELPKPITRKEKYLYELCLKGIGGEISPEEIKNAVNEYLEKNPVKPGATTEQAQQIKQNKTDIASLKVKTGSLKKDLSNKITKFYASNQGEIHLADSDDGKIMDIMLYGRSEQNQYRGKNLLPTTMYSDSAMKNGVTFINNGDGSVTAKGTSTDTTFFALWGFNTLADKGILPGLKVGDTVYVSDCLLQETNSKELLKITTNGTATINSSTTTMYVAIRINKGESVNKTFYPQIEKGSEVTSYEPYVGGQPSPSPDYPQEIKSVVNPTVKVTNKDGLKVQSVTLNNITLNAIPVKSGGNVTIDGQQYIADYVDVEHGKVIRNILKWRLGDLKYGFNNAVWHMNISELGIDGSKNGLSNMFKIQNGHYNGVTTSELYIAYDGKTAALNMRGMTDEEFKKWLREKNPEVYNVLTVAEEIPITPEEALAFKQLMTYYPVTNISVNSEQLDGLTVFNYPISIANGWNYVKQQLNDNRDYIYDMDLQSAEAYVNSEYAVALTELEV